MAGGRTISGKENSGRRKGREPDTVVEPYKASDISMLTKVRSEMFEP